MAALVVPPASGEPGLTLKRDGEIGVFRLSGVFTFREAVRRVCEAFALARESGLEKLLLVVDTADGFDSPSIADRHFMVREWANAAQGRVIAAIVAKHHHIDGEKFGIVAAANFGLQTNVFREESEALAWLGSAMPLVRKIQR